jgi:hypothetical protein
VELGLAKVLTLKGNSEVALKIYEKLHEKNPNLKGIEKKIRRL